MNKFFKKIAKNISTLILGFTIISPSFLVTSCLFDKTHIDPYSLDPSNRTMIIDFVKDDDQPDQPSPDQNSTITYGYSGSKIIGGFQINCTDQEKLMLDQIKFVNANPNDTRYKLEPFEGEFRLSWKKISGKPIVSKEDIQFFAYLPNGTWSNNLLFHVEYIPQPKELDFKYFGFMDLQGIISKAGSNQDIITPCFSSAPDTIIPSTDVDWRIQEVNNLFAPITDWISIKDGKISWKALIPLNTYKFKIKAFLKSDPTIEGYTDAFTLSIKKDLPEKITVDWSDSPSDYIYIKNYQGDSKLAYANATISPDKDSVDKSIKWSIVGVQDSENLLHPSFFSIDTHGKISWNIDKSITLNFDGKITIEGRSLANDAIANKKVLNLYLRDKSNTPNHFTSKLFKLDTNMVIYDSQSQIYPDLQYYFGNISYDQSGEKPSFDLSNLQFTIKVTSYWFEFNILDDLIFKGLFTGEKEHTYLSYGDLSNHGCIRNLIFYFNIGVYSINGEEIIPPKPISLEIDPQLPPEVPTHWLSFKDYFDLGNEILLDKSFDIPYTQSNMTPDTKFKDLYEEDNTKYGNASLVSVVPHIGLNINEKDYINDTPIDGSDPIGLDKTYIDFFQNSTYINYDAQQDCADTYFNTDTYAHSSNFDMTFKLTSLNISQYKKKFKILVDSPRKYQTAEDVFTEDFRKIMKYSFVDILDKNETIIKLDKQICSLDLKKIN